MLQNATHLRKSPPGPPNSSDEDVSCTAPATENASLRCSSNFPRLPSFLEMLQNPQILLTFEKVHNPLRLPRESTSEPPKVAWTSGALYILTSKCASRHNGVHFLDIATSKSGPNLVFCTFWLRSALRATTACTFSTSQLPKVVRTWCVLYILTSERASRHNGVHFFDISTSKSGPNLVCFVHFDFEMCFAPQRRALFRRLNFQKWSEHVSCFIFFTWKCASRHNSVQFFISHLARWLRTRRFSEPTFRPSGATNHWEKHSVSRLSYLFAHLHLLSSALSLLWSSLFYPSLLSDSSHLCFSSVHIVGSLASKLPSNIL